MQCYFERKQQSLEIDAQNALKVRMQRLSFQAKMGQKISPDVLRYWSSQNSAAAVETEQGEFITDTG